MRENSAIGKFSEKKYNRKNYTLPKQDQALLISILCLLVCGFFLIPAVLLMKLPLISEANLAHNSSLACYALSGAGFIPLLHALFNRHYKRAVAIGVTTAVLIILLFTLPQV